MLGVDGTGLRQLTDDAFKDRAPTFSPDGRRLAFHSDRQRPLRDLDDRDRRQRADAADEVDRRYGDRGALDTRRAIHRHQHGQGRLCHSAGRQGPCRAHGGDPGACGRRLLSPPRLDARRGDGSSARSFAAPGSRSSIVSPTTTRSKRCPTVVDRTEVSPGIEERVRADDHWRPTRPARRAPHVGRELRERRVSRHDDVLRRRASDNADIWMRTMQAQE